LNIEGNQMSDLMNRQIAGQLEEAARLLDDDGADPSYVRAFTLAADSVRHWPISMAVMYRHRGLEGLEEVPGVGPTLARVIRDVVTRGRLPALTRLRRPVKADVGDPVPMRPPVDELLDVDREYRQKAAAGELPLIAPRRFNPSGDAWLPVLHTRRGTRRYTALFSNTPHAHRWGRTRDWVVVYGRDASGEQQYTVITAWHGPMRGHRIVAGRGHECVAVAARRAA
jgi:hypothetical protein